MIQIYLENENFSVNKERKLVMISIAIQRGKDHGADYNRRKWSTSILQVKDHRRETRRERGNRILGSRRSSHGRQRKGTGELFVQIYRTEEIQD